MDSRSTIDSSDNDSSKRDVPSFIEPKPPLITNPFMRPRPQKGINLLEQFEEDAELEEPEQVQVYLRIKPCDVPNRSYEIRENSLITSVDISNADYGRKTQANVSKMYTFSHIFDDRTTQKEIFDRVVKENLRKLPEGHNFTLLTFGASGSGKTFTLMGTVAAPGLVPRSLEYVFRVVDAAQQPIYKPADNGADKLSYAEQEAELQWVKKLGHVSAPLRDKYRRMSTQLNYEFTQSTLDLSNRTRYYVWVSFVEIYNEAVYDLLVNCDRRSSSQLRIREDANGHVYVKGATQAFVRSGKEAYDVLVSGKYNLKVASTGIHKQSSRSHCIFTITMLTDSDSGVRTSCVRLCDLAGCERVTRTRNTGARLQESRSINTSLHVLERCLHVLRGNQRARTTASLVPYRESKLTRLLGAGLSGVRSEAFSMVVTVNPAPEYTNENKHVLQVAAVAKDIHVNNTIVDSTFESSIQNTTVASNAEVMKLRADNERLHFELVQAQARIKELSSAMETKQQEAADMMWEVVDEAKVMTREYYEALIRSQEERHQSEMDDLKEEYENKLAKAGLSSTASTKDAGEIPQCRACLAGNGENPASYLSNDEDLTDSENEDTNDTDDPCNESLEPTINKKTLSRVRLIHQHSLNMSCNIADHLDNIDKDATMDSAPDKTEDTVQDESLNETLKDSTSLTDDISDKHENVVSFAVENKVVIDNSMQNNSNCRGTFCVTDETVNTTNKPSSLTRGTYFVRNECNKSETEPDAEESYDVDKLKDETEASNGTVKFQVPEKKNAFISKISKITRSAAGSDSSLAQFEQLEMATNAIITNPKSPEEFTNIKILKEKRHYFDETIDKGREDRDISGTNTENIDKIVNKDKQVLGSKIEPNSFRDLPNEFSKKLKEKLHYLDESFDIGQKDANVSGRNIVKIDIANKNKPASDNEIEPNPLSELPDEFSNIKILKEKRTYFDDIKVDTEPIVDKKVADFKTQIDNMRSPSIVKEEIPKDYEPTTIKKLLGESFSHKNEIPSSVHKNKLLSKTHDSIDPFEGLDSPYPKVIEDINEKVIIKTEGNDVNFKTERQSIEEMSDNHTVEEFENLYNDITAPTATEFEFLVSQSSNISSKDLDPETSMNDKESAIRLKYNLRKKGNSESDEPAKEVIPTDVKVNKNVVLESTDKCEVKTKPKRNLRLRRRKNQEDGIKETDDNESKDTNIAKIDPNVKDTELKNIANLQKEFSDVTLDVPVEKKVVIDIPSPEKLEGEKENMPLGIQSCPAKSITRSRRKLFTPRVEPLDESSTRDGESGERLYIPRPSYHRTTRARRKL